MSHRHDLPSAPIFDHERFDAYHAAIDFLVVAEDVALHLPKGRAYLADQLRRAALSIVLNTAEGAGEFATADKARFYRMARRSATECVAVIDSARVMALVGDEVSVSARRLLGRTVAMLTALILAMEGRGSG